MRTCNQTGNDAPRFPWSNSPEGRTARILIQCIAYHLGYDDERMGRLRQFPPSRTTFDLFNRTLPWFAAHYNETRAAVAAERGYPAILIEPLTAADVHGRLLYLFTRPGNGDRERQYSVVGPEHPFSPQQSRPGGRREVYDRCADEIVQRLRVGEAISRDEAATWGRK